ncbi:MAG: DUF1294 domain-containing protein [Planctomycetes bacterium]|nr:DUF1294 domain-containing protein [Planctomycetota bacterium]
MVLGYLVVVNALAFVLMGLDKWKASRGARRIPESTLLLPAALLGCVGSWTASALFRHKTSKSTFRWKHLLATAISVGWVVLIVRRGL